MDLSFVAVMLFALGVGMTSYLCLTGGRRWETLCLAFFVAGGGLLAGRAGVEGTFGLALIFGGLALAGNRITAWVIEVLNRWDGLD